MNKKVLIVPDVHGREFWKDPVKNSLSNVDKIVFLGDYLDPYPQEGIDFLTALKNFEEIIKLKKSNSDKVILLYGNHDCHYCDYLSDSIFPCSRFEERFYNRVSNIFKNNKDLFQFFYKEGKYLFSHAGISKEWIRKYCNCTLSELLNNESKAYNSLWVVSRIRGGWENFGSCVWSDLRDFSNEIEGTYQIFGHTQLHKEFFGPLFSNEENFACLDCRKCFLLDIEDQIIIEYESRD